MRTERRRRARARGVVFFFHTKVKKQNASEASRRALEEATNENVSAPAAANSAAPAKESGDPADEASRAAARERLEEVERRAAALEMELRAAAKESGEGAAAAAAARERVETLLEENARLTEVVAAAGGKPSLRRGRRRERRVRAFVRDCQAASSVAARKVAGDALVGRIIERVAPLLCE